MPLTRIGFYSSSTSHNFDRMYGLLLCRGNTSPELCQSCIKTTSEDIMNRCLNNKKEITCHVRQEKIPLVHTIPNLLLSKAHPFEFDANGGLGLQTELVTSKSGEEPSERKRKKEDDEMRKEEDDVFALIFFFQKSNQ
ncbi:hypothetical protein POTOM_018218 [Populus tomentosa]|uniref:Gnk2-homologous domain-containing protein n=1 Tax=Populus tomentosa TaxID=118781 RepID=A0A8X8D4W2_POPTO|nr:hypothetical protein POTOM_018218 [Populus tomentosa]